MTKEERKLALYCLKASSDYHSEVCEECINYPNCDHTIQDDVTETIIKELGQEPCEDAISRESVIEYIEASEADLGHDSENELVCQDIKELPSVNPQPKTGHCKDCKWWKDSDGEYRRGSGAESPCPINRIEVFEGNGYCYMFEPQERSDKE